MKDPISREPELVFDRPNAGYGTHVPVGQTGKPNDPLRIVPWRLEQIVVRRNEAARDPELNERGQPGPPAHPFCARVSNSLFAVQEEDRLVTLLFHVRAVARVDEPDLERHPFLDDVIRAQLAVCWAEIPRRDSFGSLIVE